MEFKPFYLNITKKFIQHEEAVQELDGTHKSAEPVSKITLNVCPGLPILFLFEIYFKK